MKATLITRPPRAFLNVEEVMLLTGYKRNEAYKFMREINRETEKRDL